MLRVLKLAAVLSVSSFAILAAPFVAGGAGALNMPGYTAYAEQGGNGGGKGNGGGNGGGESNENPGNSGGGSGKPAKGAGANSDETVSVASRKGASAELSERNLHARLAGLNSLKRDVNGLMNSSDLRMEGIREFVLAGVALEGALDELDAATAALGDAKKAYDDLIGALNLLPYDGAEDAYGDFSVAALEQRLANLQDLSLVEGEEGYDQWLAEIESLATVIPLLQEAEAALDGANDWFNEATDAVAAAELGTNDDALKAALLLAANDNRLAQYGDEYISEELLGWAKSVLGVGDANGAIDAYIKQQ